MWIVAEHDNYPTCFYNMREDEWQGIAIDVLSQIHMLTGLEFEVANGPTETWADIFPRLESGEVSMVTELIYSSERAGRFLWTDEPYSTDYYALLSLAEHEDVNINQILYSKVGVVQDSAYADVFGEWFPDHQSTLVYGDFNEGFKALNSGEIDMLMASRNLLLSATNYHENPGYKVNLMFDHSYESSFGFHRDARLLASIVSKTQQLVDTQTIADRWTRKVFDYRGKLAQQQVFYLLGLSGLLVCILGLITILFVRHRQMNKNLERIVRERTHALEIQTEAAQVASRAKGDFLSRMSHEIRPPSMPL